LGRWFVPGNCGEGCGIIESWADSKEASRGCFSGVRVIRSVRLALLAEVVAGAWVTGGVGPKAKRQEGKCGGAG
jgi:hypothetical protein